MRVGVYACCDGGGVFTVSDGEYGVPLGGRLIQQKELKGRSVYIWRSKSGREWLVVWERGVREKEGKGEVEKR